MQTAMIDLRRPDGGNCPAFASQPTAATASTAGLVIIQEWWGLHDQIKSVAKRFAVTAYRVLVPVLYRGQCTRDKAEAEHLMQGLDFFPLRVRMYAVRYNCLKPIARRTES